jgi:hypothetical protein
LEMVGLEKALEKLYTEEVFGQYDEMHNVKGFEGIDALEVGVPKEVNFTSKVTGIGNKFPSGTDKGKGRMTRLPDGTVDAHCTGSVTTDKGDQFEWQSHEVTKMVEGKKLKGLDIVTISTRSQDLLWMNELIIVLETEYDPSAKKIIQTGYKLK